MNGQKAWNVKGAKKKKKTERERGRERESSDKITSQSFNL
jgi:hypothetical protein